MSRIVRFAAIAAILFAAPAVAQNIVIQSHAATPMTDAKGDVRVSISMNFFVAAPTDDSEAALKAQEQARRALYESAGRECDVLRAAIASDCRLESININVNRSFGAQVPQGFNANGSFGFHIRLK